jgi:integrase
MLRGATNHHAKESLHYGLARVTPPPKGPPRDRWLTRSEAAQLLWACWRYLERQTVHRSRQKGRLIATDKRPLRYLARFILIDRHARGRDRVGIAIPARRPFVRRPRPRHLLSAGNRSPRHQQAADASADSAAAVSAYAAVGSRGVVTSHFVKWQGAPIKSVKTGFKHAVDLAGLRGKVTPHTLRHTAATRLTQRGVSIWQGRRLSRHVGRDDRTHPRPPSS